MMLGEHDVGIVEVAVGLLARSGSIAGGVVTPARREREHRRRHGDGNNQKTKAVVHGYLFHGTIAAPCGYYAM